MLFVLPYISKLDACVGMKRQAINFDDEVLKAIDDYRRSREKIPTFSKAVIELVELGLKHSKK
jgi:hypothetical protein